MNYQKIYDRLIESRKTRLCDDNVYYERHHIVMTQNQKILYIKVEK